MHLFGVSPSLINIIKKKKKNYPLDGVGLGSVDAKRKFMPHDSFNVYLLRNLSTIWHVCNRIAFWPIRIKLIGSASSSNILLIFFETTPSAEITMGYILIPLSSFQICFISIASFSYFKRFSVSLFF